MERKKILQVKNLKKYFPCNTNFYGKVLNNLKAVDDVSFDIYKGETLGLVGESGCGKTTTGRTIVRLYNPTDGEIIFNDVDIAKLRENQMKPQRAKMHMIFQDPYASLNPRMTVHDIISEPIASNNKGYTRKDVKVRVGELLDLVGLNTDHSARFPHEFSGGQRQRIGIARSLAADPEFIVCDEPISALDVSIQAQIVNLLEDLQAKLGLTYLFIAHDLSMVKYISNRVGVMYLGKIVEITSSEVLYKNPQHTYTKALMSAIPIPDPDIESNRRRTVLSGSIPSPIDAPPGCSFQTRCPNATGICKEMSPALKEIDSDHYVACHRIS